MKIDRITCAVVLGAAVFLVWGAGYYTVFDDEAFSTQRYVLPLGQLVKGLWHGVEPDPPLYYMLQHAWISWVGVRPLALRGMSILFFIAALPFLRGAAEAWAGPRAGRLALLLAAFHPMHLFFGFAARWYSLFFFCCSVMLFAMARIENGPGRRWQGIMWMLAAISCCYTNYFGLAVVSMLALRGFFADRANRRAWAIMFGTVLVIFAPWFPPFIHELRRFPHVSANASAYATSAARGLVALFAGNLASPDAWYVWAGFAVFALAALILVAARPRLPVTPLILLTGSFALGVGTLTLIDKYAMILSGPACVLAAAVLAPQREGTMKTVRSIAIAGLWLGAAGCGMNWITDRCWSSLRWVDPFQKVVRDHVYDTLVATHPSVRYYYGCLDPAHWNGRVLPADWRARAELVRTPAAAARQLGQLSASASGRLTTIQTAAIASDSAGWPELQAALRGGWRVSAEETHLADPAAELKDRLDPQYIHPAYRIVARTYVPSGRS